MATFNSETQVKKIVVLCPMPVSDSVSNLFAKIFVNLTTVIRYVSENIGETDSFHLIIPLDCLEDLLNDPIYKFPQVQLIEIYYDDNDDALQIQRFLNPKCEKLQFCSVHNLPRRLQSIELNNALVSLNSVDRNMINAIISSIEDRISAKRSVSLIRDAQILKPFACPIIYGFPVKNKNEIDSSFICPSCQLVFQQPYQLQCKHHLCSICINIQKKCTICCKTILPDKLWFDEDFQITMQNLKIFCSSCDWIGPLEVYQEHFIQNHQQILICLIRNLQIRYNDFVDWSITSLNGTCIWKVSGIDDTTNDPRKSIYSSPFYSFSNGYKMCLRLFLNGDVKARDTHMSLYLVLMRDRINDVNLQWPFKFKVKFTLINHLLSNNNQSVSFWPDITSNCFQYPTSDINIPYGKSKCFFS
ncbi:unnamed protein product [Adineta steineri]|uniref:MATH domain-containing protein n=1 Tax=Adineta steineri TaxID=433720 RepID=A0A819XQI1_9BILA|nr:unnamed protein product [Adineta steineri]